MSCQSHTTSDSTTPCCADCAESASQETNWTLGDHFTALRGGSPAAIFDQYLKGDTRLRKFGEALEVIGAPGGRMRDDARLGDLVIRRGLADGEVAELHRVSETSPIPVGARVPRNMLVLRDLSIGDHPHIDDADAYDAPGLPHDDEEAWDDFDAESDDPNPAPNGADAPFAPNFAAGSFWPIASTHSRGRLVSCQTVSGSFVGAAGRAFGASRSGGRRYHVGVDLFGRFGDPVHAIEDGEILRIYPFCCGDNKTSAALFVRHANVSVNYGEVNPNSLRALGLRVGDRVSAGQQIGTVGRNPGGSSMIHFEIYTPDVRSNRRWMRGARRPAQLYNPTRALLDLRDNGAAPGSAAPPVSPPMSPPVAPPPVIAAGHRCRPGEGPPAAVPDPAGRGPHPLIRQGRTRRYSRNPSVGDAQNLLNVFLAGLDAGMAACAFASPANASAAAALRRALNASGQIPLDVDCRFGANTARAVKLFQLCKGLAPDAIVGPLTWAALIALRGASPTPVAPPPVAPPVTLPVSPPGRRDWTTVSAEDRRRYVMNALITRYGYAANAAAGLVGNLWAESGILPNRVEGSRRSDPMRARDFHGRTRTFTAAEIMNRSRRARRGPRRPGVGLAQWTSSGRRAGLFRHAFNGTVRGGDILFDMDAQIDYLVHELGSTHRHVDRVLRNPGVSLEDASDTVLFRYETPASVLRPGGGLRARNDPAVRGVRDERRRYSRAALAAHRAGPIR